MQHQAPMVTRLLSLLLLLPLALPGCQTVRAPGPPSAEASPAGQTLTLIVSSLQMHLRQDSYRSGRATTHDGRDVFEAALWRLDRLQRSRDRAPLEWENIDIVVEFARARALERQRRYAEAGAAYERVAESGSLLAEPADEASLIMQRFAANAGEPDELGGAEAEFLDQRVARLRELAWEFRETSYGPLAMEELEAWEVLRLDWIARHWRPREAIQAGRRLVERHSESKLYAQHLIRLGDLYAEAARREQMSSRAKHRRFDATRYEALLDHAFAAYELAGEQRRPALRRQAETKIEALLATHHGNLLHAR